MLLDDIFYLFLCHCLSKLLHREIDICVSDIPRVVGIELLENSMQFLFGHVMSYIDGGWKELTIVDLSIAIVIEFSYDAVQLININFDTLLCQNISELVHINHSCSFSVNSFKLCS